MWLNEFGDIDEVVFYVFAAISAVIVILALANILVGCFCLKAYSGATSADFNIVLGACILCYTVLVRGISPAVEWAPSYDQLETICQFYPAALLLGLTMFIGGLMVKSWGIFLYNKYNNDKKPNTEEWKPNMWIWFLLIIAAAVSVAWCVEFTPHLQDMSPMNNITLECKNDNGREYEWQVSTSVWHAFLLLLAVIAVFPNCAAVKTAEANILSLVTMNTLFAVVAGICVYFLYEADVTVHYTINGGLILWFCLFANIMFLASKILGNRRGKAAEREY